MSTVTAPVPALYPCTVTHVRTAPLRYGLRLRTYMWLIDPDRPPVLPRVLRPLAGFDARDHFGGTSPTIRAGLDRYLASHGVELGGGRVVMLAHARVLGHVFNPLTLYWCHGPGGEPLCVVAEVHNTYGERHCYLLRPGDRAAGADENTFWVDKELYVSPFFPVDGGYRMRLPEPAARLELTVHLERDGGRPFTATVRGERRAATPWTVLRAALRHPLSTAVVSAGIRYHGIRLHLRGLPVRPRPRHRPQEGVK
ncbi:MULTISPECIES: DUF1365 domain-containing protein [unclassified Streptomyces]|uniref:DUF1365 domain-containing protein n=1 Tax=unclassified Streptomyces TaxID=2593676 RepID=UPI00386C5F3F